MHGVTAYPNTLTCTLLFVFICFLDRLINICIFFIEIFCLDSFINSPFLHFCDESYSVIHCYSQGLRSSHSSESCRNIQCSLEGATKMLARGGRISFICALY